eukprot:6209593-Pleurochrysis_carterae.AAC.1
MACFKLACCTDIINAHTVLRNVKNACRMQCTERYPNRASGIRHAVQHDRKPDHTLLFSQKSLLAHAQRHDLVCYDVSAARA